MVLLGLRFLSGAEIQMFLRRIRSPKQQQEKDRHQRGERSNTGKNLPQAARP